MEAGTRPVLQYYFYNQNSIMAIKNKTIRNLKTGQDIRFLQTGKDTNGRLLEMETTYNEHSKEPVAHYHPYQVEDFTVLSGELTVRIDGQLKLLKQGETLPLRAGKNIISYRMDAGDTGGVTLDFAAVAKGGAVSAKP